MNPYYQDNLITIYNADCKDVLRFKWNGWMITDPPYGINYNAERQNLKTGRKYGDILNDNGQYDLRFIFAVECPKIIFGANCFPHLLPYRGRWLVWDKRCDPKADKALGSPFELAWCSLTSGYDKIYRVQHGGFINADKGKRVHPTQKPVKLLTQVILDVIKDEKTIILDPFMGSGTTLIAAKNLGIRAVGIEIEEKYCEIAVRRLQQEIMFVSRVEMGAQANNRLHTTGKGGEENWLFNLTSGSAAFSGV